MIHLLSQKQTLAQGVLHGDNDLRSMKLPSGRNAFLEQVAELLQDTQQTASPAPASGQFDQLPKEIRYLAIREADAAPPIVLAVAEHDSPALREQTQAIVNACYPQQAPVLEMLDLQTFATIQRLAQAGLLTLHPQMHALYGSAEIAASASPPIPAHWLEAARQKRQQAERPWRLAELLFNSQFYQEAFKPWREAIELLLAAVAWQQGMGESIIREQLSIEQIKELVTQQALPASGLPLINFLREPPGNLDENQLQNAWRESQALVQQIVGARLVNLQSEN